MFRKTTAATAAILLTSVLTLSHADASSAKASEMGRYPTQHSASAEIRHMNTTTSNQLSTNMDAATTYTDHSWLDSAASPTEFPQSGMLTGASGVQLASTGQDYTTQYVLMQEQMMMNLLNQDRKNNSLAPLALDEALCRIARIKSADMRDKGYFAHESPTYGDVREMLQHFGYPYAGAGENIARHANVDKAQAAFMSSPGHRANILSNVWTKAGIGIVLDPQGFIYATQIFAR